MQPLSANDNYLIFFSPRHIWTITAEPEVSDWLHHFGIIMGLTKTRKQ